MLPNAALCPVNVRKAFDNYVYLGVPLGSFLTAVLSNDLKEAIGRADDTNLVALPHIVAYLYNEIPAALWGSPAALWGSPAKVAAHIEAKRLERMERES